MRRRHQKGSLQKRKRATGWAWIGMWRDAQGRRLSRNLGKYPVVSKAEAQARLEGEMAEVKQGAEISPEATFGDFVRTCTCHSAAGSGKRLRLQLQCSGSIFT
jgi:hypothetical protein